MKNKSIAENAFYLFTRIWQMIYKYQLEYKKKVLFSETLVTPHMTQVFVFNNHMVFLSHQLNIIIFVVRKYGYNNVYLSGEEIVISFCYNS